VTLLPTAAAHCPSPTLGAARFLSRSIAYSYAAQSSARLLL
jgi:hypothetical protein